MIRRQICCSATMAYVLPCKMEATMNKLSFFCCFCFCAALAACSTSGPGVFGRKSLHDQYGQKLEAAGLKQTALGIKWFAAAATALAQPVAITIPYRERGYFSASSPTAVGLKFAAKRGQKLILQLDKKSLSPLTLYAEIWKLNDGDPSLQAALDTAQNKFDFEVEDDAEFLIRLQPELLGSGAYELSISTGPSLGFPVAGGKARIGSIWGDDRDAGVRRHEGIDIFATRGTPAIASAAGTVRVNENNLGGKVVWLRQPGKRFTLYYAHLDTQLVTTGQRVRVGDTVGLVGNTGNARNTPAHLHFGIYGMGGAVDPLPFVAPGIKRPAAIRSEPDFEKPVRLVAHFRSAGGTISRNTVAFPLAQTVKGYRVEFPDQTIIELEKEWIEQRTWRKTLVRSKAPLLEKPDSTAPEIRTLPTGTAVSLFGIFNDFGYADLGGVKGWISLKLVE
jgi:peptidoglycan LD-endopeptidase LytH